MLTSVKNPWVKELRKLQQSKYRRSHQQFLIEGTHLVQEAIATHYPLNAACATPQWQSEHGELWQQLQTQATRHELISKDVLQALSTTKTPDGVVAIAPIQSTSMPATVPHLGIALETIQDPGNVGTLIRTAAAVNSDGFWVSEDSVDLTHPKVLRASAGQWFRVQKQVTSDLPAQVSEWHSNGCQVLATAAESEVPYWEVDFTQPTVLLMGNEGNGLSPESVARASRVIAIPMADSVESLNVGVAAAVILFEALRQRQSQTADHRSL